MILSPKNINIMNINLTKSQKEKLRELWFIYGNSGVKCTLLNHKLIQGFVEYNEDRREDYKNANKNIEDSRGKEFAINNGITQECLNAISNIIDID